MVRPRPTVDGRSNFQNILHQNPTGDSRVDGTRIGDENISWDLSLSMIKMRNAWEVKVGDRMRDLLGDAGAARERPLWILEIFLEQIMKYWESPEYKAFYEQNKRNRNEGRGIGDKKRQYVNFHSEEFWTKFHEVRQTVEEETAAIGAPMPDDLQLMASIFGGLSRGQL
ncbi:hypothetical protein M9H77_12252 [Catharanthus roseus]|uniref:Uncharacterized protein n=1 Tax=Catharanthus roseus TaxID=4058 RepID=A0ACC0BH23_CATRO|nr:hypothetical protein M9H77_12252 [Catharanthus roseus]